MVIAAMVVSASIASLPTVQAGQSPASLRFLSPNGLVINEIYDSQSGSNEYFELYNTSAVTINLSTYVVYNHDDSVSLSSLSSPSIGAGQFRAIGPAQLGGNWFAGTTGIARTDFLGLVNTSPTDTVIDVVNFGGAPNPNWPNYDRFSQYFFTSNIPALPAEDGTRSLQRWPDGFDNDVGTDFASIASSPGAPSCGDPFEDGDNSAAGAPTQSPGTTILHRLCPAGDQDWTIVPMSTSSTYTLRATAQGSSVDTVLRLYDSQNVLLAEDNNPGSRDSIINFRPTSSANFRLQVTDANGQGGAGQNFLYNLTVNSTLVPTSTPTPGGTATPSTVTPTPIPCADSYEPDNGRDTAKEIELNSSQRHSLCLPPPGTISDQDWIFFLAGGNKIYSLYTSNLTGPTDTIITLYDSRGIFLAENDDAQPGSGLASRIDYNFTGGNGMYFLRIRDRNGNSGIGYEYTINFTSQGGIAPTSTPSPTATINPNATPTPGQCADAYETDGVPAEAKDILIGTTQRHSICPATDADWVRFYARAGKVYTIRTANLGPGLDTYMYLFDSNGSTMIAQNDDGGDGVASRIDFYPLRDDFYFAQIKNAGDIGGSLETYDLILTVAPGVPQPPATATGGPAPNTPTTVVQPTRPPVPSPTSGGIPPTPPSQATIAPPIPEPVSTTIPPGGGFPPPQPTGQLPPAPTLPPAEPSATSSMPNVPRTGHPPDLQKDSVKPVVPEKPAGPQSKIEYVPFAFRFFYDGNRNKSFDAGEGIRGLSIYLVKENGEKVATGSLTTSSDGYGALRLLEDKYRIVVPYFGVNMPLADFAGRETHNLWLPPLDLPDRVP